MSKKEEEPTTAVDPDEFQRICNALNLNTKVLRQNNVRFTPHQRTFLLFRVRDMVHALETSPSEEEAEEDVYETLD